MNKATKEQLFSKSARAVMGTRNKAREDAALRCLQLDRTVYAVHSSFNGVTSSAQGYSVGSVIGSIKTRAELETWIQSGCGGLSLVVEAEDGGMIPVETLFPSLGVAPSHYAAGKEVRFVL